MRSLLPQQLVYDLTLISRNDDDFRKILGLKYLNPFTDI